MHRKSLKRAKKQIKNQVNIYTEYGSLLSLFKYHSSIVHMQTRVLIFKNKIYLEIKKSPTYPRP